MTSLKQQIQTWSNALRAYESQDFERCTELFQTICGEGAKFQFNIGLVHATIGSHELAVQHFEQAIAVDPFLAVAYFQSGVSNFLLERFLEAKRDFEDAYIYMRGNQTIDYKQLGLNFCLYSCEALFNRGLAALKMNEKDEGTRDLQQASREKQTNEHDVIDEALADQGEGYTVFSVPVGVLYRPSEKKLKNLKTKNYLGAAKLIAATDQQDAFTGFTGVTLARKATLLRSAAVFENDHKGNEIGQPLTRSQNRAPRMEREQVALVVAGLAEASVPLPRNQTALPVPGGGLERRATPPRATGLDSSKSNPAKGIRNAVKQNGAGLPSPPSSDELAVPAARMTRDRETTYSGALDAYYDPCDLSPVCSLPHGPTPEGQPIERVAEWAYQHLKTLPPAGQNLSRNTSASEAVVRRPERSNTMPIGGVVRGHVRGPRGDEEGLSDGTVATEREMSKIRVKLRYQGDTRGMSLSPDIALDDFVERVRRKFERPGDVSMKYKDAAAEFVSIIDEDDFESAIDEARENAKGSAEGKLDIYIQD